MACGAKDIEDAVDTFRKAYDLPHYCRVLVPGELDDTEKYSPFKIDRKANGEIASLTYVTDVFIYEIGANAMRIHQVLADPSDSFTIMKEKAAYSTDAIKAVAESDHRTDFILMSDVSTMRTSVEPFRSALMTIITEKGFQVTDKRRFSDKQLFGFWIDGEPAVLSVNVNSDWSHNGYFNNRYTIYATYSKAIENFPFSDIKKDYDFLLAREIINFEDRVKEAIKSTAAYESKPWWQFFRSSK